MIFNNTHSTCSTDVEEQGDPNGVFPANYCPISILSSLGKRFTFIVGNWLRLNLRGSQILLKKTNHVSGKEHSTIYIRPYFAFTISIILF